MYELLLIGVFMFISNPRAMCELLLIGVSLFISNPRAMCELLLIAGFHMTSLKFKLQNY